MIHPHYILAKYIPEVLRNEPRNIGVIAWTPWGVFAKFLGEQNGTLDARKIPSWIQSKDAYREWHGSWRSALLKKKIKGNQGREIEASDVSFLDALGEKSKGNYILSDKGSVLDIVTREDTDAMLEFLFSTLIETETDKTSAKAEFDLVRTCNRIIKHTRAFRSRHLHRDKSVMCKITPHVIESFNFDYYIGNGQPQRLYQRVPLGQRNADPALHDAAWKFEKVIKANIISRDTSAAIVMPTEEQKEDARFKKAISVLETITRVIDLSSDEALFTSELNSIEGEIIP